MKIKQTKENFWEKHLQAEGLKFTQKLACLEKMDICRISF